MHNNSKTVIYIHIPKAAGTTLSQVVARQYNPQEIFYINIELSPSEKRSIHAFRALPDRVKANFHYIWGHIPFGLHMWLAQSATYITMLRNPLDRVVSYYYHALHHPRHHLHPEVVQKNMSLEDFVHRTVDINENNLQTRWVSGYANFDSLMPPHEVLPANALDLAKENLKNFFPVCGLTERFDESLLLMQKVLGWNNPFYRKKNVGKKPAGTKLPASTVKLIEKYEEKDIALYNFARSRLVAMLDAYHVDEGHVRRFQAMNCVFGTPQWIFNSVYRKLAVKVHGIRAGFK